MGAGDLFQEYDPPPPVRLTDRGHIVLWLLVMAVVIAGLWLLFGPSVFTTN